MKYIKLICISFILISSIGAINTDNTKGNIHIIKPSDIETSSLIMCFDAGHYANYNRSIEKSDGTIYSEGEAMLNLSLHLQKFIPNSIFTRLEYDYNPSYKTRAEYAFNNNADIIISLHSNSSTGIKVYYSINQPENKQHAEKLLELISQYTGIRAYGVVCWENADKPGTDYLAMIKRPYDLGIKEIYVVEHGSHEEFANNYTHNIMGCIKAYLEFYKYLTQENSMEVK